MTYIVLWIWVQSMMVSCPVIDAIPDIFGRTQPMVSMTLQVCYRDVEHNMRREFSTKIEAEGLLEEAGKMLNARPLPRDVQVWDNGDIRKFRRDVKGEYREVEDGN